VALGRLAIVLHAHLPFVRHPAHENFLEERWLYEAITETYVPLLELLDALERDRLAVRLTLSFSPTLLAMLADPLLQDRYVRYLDRQVELAESEVRRTRHDVRFHRLAQWYLSRHRTVRSRFLEEWGRDLPTAFRAFRARGVIETMTCAATHGFLPLLATSPAAVRAQVEVAASEHRRVFGESAQGFWLPECGYRPGIDADLARAGFRYSIVDTLGLAHATPRAVYGVYAPVACESGVAVFGRDPDSARQVWSAEEGYPGDPWYRDFHRDIGFDLDYDYLRPHLHPSGQRLSTGFKYYRVTGRTDDKQPYDPGQALARAEVHARDFVEARVRQIEWLARIMDRPPIVVCPYDAELFGHWWHEGPVWLAAVLRVAAATPALEVVTLADDLARHSVLQRATPSASSWGGQGYNEVWLSGQNDWIYRHLHAAAERLEGLCRRHVAPDALTRRALTQALRELLLAQSSDWPFMMSRDTTVEYAVRRVNDHLVRCGRLCEQVERRAIDDLQLAALEEADNLFPTLDHHVFAPPLVSPQSMP
jgi:1,4-alpha-glucan branching enzyme